jgi:hypothetical protein
MTIAIGVLGSGASRGDTLILAADTQGTQGEDKSTDRLHKIFIGHNVYAVVAGADVNKAGSLFSRIDAKINALPIKHSEAIFAAIHSSMFEFHKMMARYEVLPWFSYDLDQLCVDLGNGELPKRDGIEEALRAYDLNFELIIGAFDNDGRALLFQTYATPAVESDSMMVYLDTKCVPGFAAAGTAVDVGLFWLNYRDHTLSYPDIRSAYHAYEAKRMAEKSGYVNERTNMLIATASRHDWIDDNHQKSGNWSLDMFKKMFKKFGPRGTATIGAVPQDPRQTKADPKHRPPSQE